MARPVSLLAGAPRWRSDHRPCRLRRPVYGHPPGRAPGNCRVARVSPLDPARRAPLCRVCRLQRGSHGHQLTEPACAPSGPLWGAKAPEWGCSRRKSCTWLAKDKSSCGIRCLAVMHQPAHGAVHQHPAVEHPYTNQLLRVFFLKGITGAALLSADLLRHFSFGLSVCNPNARAFLLQFTCDFVSLSFDWLEVDYTVDAEESACHATCDLMDRRRSLVSANELDPHWPHWNATCRVLGSQREALAVTRHSCFAKRVHHTVSVNLQCSEEPGFSPAFTGTRVSELDDWPLVICWYGF